MIHQHHRHHQNNYDDLYSGTLLLKDWSALFFLHCLTFLFLYLTTRLHHHYDENYDDEDDEDEDDEDEDDENDGD